MRSSAPPPRAFLFGLRRRPRSAALLRLGYRVAYRVLQAWARLSHPTARGVKCLLRGDDGRVLFVRHTYGNRRQWEIPGGGARAGEDLADAARREAYEELGASLGPVDRIGEARGGWYGRDEVLVVFAARWPGGPVRADPVEIASAGWFSLSRPPQPLGPSTVAALSALGPGAPTPPAA